MGSQLTTLDEGRLWGKPISSCQIAQLVYMTTYMKGGFHGSRLLSAEPIGSVGSYWKHD